MKIIIVFGNRRIPLIWVNTLIHQLGVPIMEWNILQIKLAHLIHYTKLVQSWPRMLKGKNRKDWQSIQRITWVRTHTINHKFMTKPLSMPKSVARVQTRNPANTSVWRYPTLNGLYVIVLKNINMIIWARYQGLLESGRFPILVVNWFATVQLVKCGTYFVPMSFMLQISWQQLFFFSQWHYLCVVEIILWNWAAINGNFRFESADVKKKET